MFKTKPLNRGNLKTVVRKPMPSEESVNKKHPRQLNVAVDDNIELMIEDLQGAYFHKPAFGKRPVYRSKAQVVREAIVYEHARMFPNWRKEQREEAIEKEKEKT